MAHTTKHTPGPWVVTEHSSGMICVAGPDNKDLCAVGYNRTNGRDDVANASLIAAAPAMYEALGSLITFLVENDERWRDNQFVLDAKAALAQAEGR